MKKKRSLILSFLLILTLNTLVGCAKSNEEEGKQITSNTETKKIQMISNGGGNSSASTKDGYYTIWNNENGMKNIMYVDYKTKKQVYLCDKAECKHDNENCTSYIDLESAMRTNMLLSDNNHLYFINTESNMGNSKSTTTSYGDNGIQMLDKPTTIYKMNLDGSNKSLLASLGSGEGLGNTFFTDGEYIYGISMKSTSVKIDENTSYKEGTDYKLIGIPINGGEAKEITKWDSNKNILGVYDNKLVIKDLKFEKELTEEEKRDDEKYLEALKKAKNIIETYDISKDKFEDLNIDGGSSDNYYTMYGNQVFYHKVNGDKIMAIDLDSKNEAVFLEGQSSNIMQIYDGYMITSNWDENNKDFRIVNIKDKREEKLSLLKNNGWAVNIIAEFEDSFFVESNCDEINEYVEWAGVTQTVNANWQYSLIKKDDYFKNNKSFEKVELIQENLN